MNTKMRILYVLEASGGGVGRHVTDLIEYLSERGHEIHLIYSPLRADRNFKRYIKIFKNRQNIKLIQIPIHKKMGFSSIKIMKFIRSYIQDNGPFSVIHSHSSIAGGLTRIATLGIKGIKLYTPHAFVTMNPKLGMHKRNIYSFIEVLLSFNTHKIITVSPDESKHAIEIGITNRKLVCIPNGIKNIDFLERKVIRTQLGIKDSEIVIGFVGRIEEQKAPEVLLESFSILCNTSSNIRLIIIGTGSLEEEIKLLAKELNLEDKILWLGEVEGKSFMPAFDIFALPSRYEGLPYVLIEALSAGLPIVSTNVGGANLLITPNKNGFITPINDSKLFGEALLKLLDNRDLRFEFGRHSKFIASKYSIDQMGKNIEELYLKTIK